MSFLSKIWKDPVWSKVIAQIIIFLGSALILALPIYSKITKGDYLILLVDNWIMLTFVFLGLLIILLFLKLLKKKPEAYAAVDWIPARGWEDLGEKEYFGVYSVVRKPLGDIMDVYFPTNAKPEDLRIKTPPRCPKCSTDLKEKKGFWRFKWFLCQVRFCNKK